MCYHIKVLNGVSRQLHDIQYLKKLLLLSCCQILVELTIDD